MRNLNTINFSDLVENEVLDLSLFSHFFENATLKTICDKLEPFHSKCPIKVLRLPLNSQLNTTSSQRLVAFIKTMKQLDELILKGSGINDETIDGLIQNTAITKLHIESPTISDAAFANLKTSKTLTDLFLFCGNLTDKVIDYINQIPQVEKLTIINEQITADAFTQLSEHPSLLVLEVQCENLNDTVVNALANSKKLVSLHLTSDNITDHCAAALAANSNLQELQVTSSKLSDQFIAYFRPNSTLKNLILFTAEKYDGEQLFADDPVHPNFKFHQERLLALKADEFKKAIFSNQETVNMVLGSDSLQQKLNGLSIISSDVKTLKQAFPNSCAANTIMNYLCKFGKLKENEVNYVTELKIYKEIWIKPGDMADFNKIIKFLEKQNIIMKFIEDKNFSQQLLKEEKYKTLYKAQCADIKKPTMEVDFNTLQNGYFLLLVINKDGNPHIISASHEKNKFRVFDPGKNQELVFDSFAEFLNKSGYIFAGIALEIKDPRPMAALNRYGTKFGDASSQVDPSANQDEYKTMEKTLN